MYKDEFTDAAKRTTRLGLICPAIETDHKPYLVGKGNKDFQMVMQGIFSKVTKDYLVAKCFEFHTSQKETIENIFNTQCYFTLGYIECPGQNFFYQTEDTLNGMLKNKVTDSVSLHAWLTLPSMEIIDLTFFTSYAVRNKLPEGIGMINCKHGDINDGTLYHPLLIGNDFLIKIGAIRNVIFE